MKKTFIIALVLGLCSLNFAQSPNQDEELTKLKKQVTTLKIKNSRLEKNATDLKNSLSKIEKSVNELDSKLKVVNDSLRSERKTINHLKRKSNLLLLSLTHRKKWFISGFIIGIVISIAMAVFVIMKYNKDRKKQETMFAEVKRDLEEEISKIKTELQNQINSTKNVLEQKIKDQEKKINELKK